MASVILFGSHSSDWLYFGLPLGLAEPGELRKKFWMQLAFFAFPDNEQ